MKRNRNIGITFFKVDLHCFGGVCGATHPSNVQRCPKVVDIKKYIQELIPPERREELMKKYEKMNKEIDKLERKLRDMREERKNLEKMLVALGMIEKPVPPATIRGEKSAVVRGYILDLGPGAEFKYSDVVRATNQSRGIVWNVIRAMEAKGEIEKVGRGVYRVIKAREEGSSNSISTGESSE